MRQWRHRTDQQLRPAGSPGCDNRSSTLPFGRMRSELHHVTRVAGVLEPQCARAHRQVGLSPTLLGLVYASDCLAPPAEASGSLLDRATGRPPMLQPLLRCPPVAPSEFLRDRLRTGLSLGTEGRPPVAYRPQRTGLAPEYDLTSEDKYRIPIGSHAAYRPEALPPSTL